MTRAMAGDGAIAARATRLGWPATAALAACLFAPGAAAFAGERITVQIGTVLATNTGNQFDAHLAAMRQQFERLFHYTSYQLVKQERRDVALGVPASFDIPGGRLLRVVPKGERGGRMAMSVSLVQDSRVLVNTDLSLSAHGNVLVGGPRHQDGNLIIWIGAKAN